MVGSRLNKQNELFTHALRVCRESLISVGVFSAVANLLMLIPAFYMLNVYDKALGNNSMSTLAALSLIAGALFILLGILEALRSRVLIAVGEKIARTLSPILYQITFLNAVHAGPAHATARPLLDLQSMRQFLTTTGVVALFDAPWVPLYLLVLFLFHPLLGGLGFAAAVVFLGIAIMNQRVTTEGLQSVNELGGVANTQLARNIRNAEVAASMAILPRMLDKWGDIQDQLLLKQATVSSLSANFAATIKTLRLAVQSAALGTGAYLAILQEISPGMVIAGSILIGRALQPVEQSVGAWKGFVEFKSQYDRTNDLLNNYPLPPDTMPLPPITGSVTAASATIGAPGTDVICVANASFTCAPGTVSMIIGPSGAGKSSLIKATLGLWPTMRGQLRIDGTEAAKFNRAELGAQIGYLPQDIELFDGSVGENICRFEESDPGLIIQAAKDAGVHEFILSLPNGYDTMLGAPGGMLSPGQCQRIALARALYRRPKLVILDEPNSNLDHIGEAALVDSIKMLRANDSTVIVISHRTLPQSTVDQVIMLVNGQITDKGSYADVFGRLNESSNKQRVNPRDSDRPRSLPSPVQTVLPPKL